MFTRIALFFLPVFSLPGVLIFVLGLLLEKPQPQERPSLSLPFLSPLEKKLLLLLCLFSGLPLFNAAKPLFHLAGFISHYLLPMGFCYLLLKKLRTGVLNTQQLRQSLIAGLTLLALIGIANYFLNWHGEIKALILPIFDHPALIDFSLNPAEGRAWGPALNPNLLGLLMSLGIPLLLSETAKQKNSSLRLGYGVITAILWMALIVSFSRAAWLGACAALLWLLISPLTRRISFTWIGSILLLLMHPAIQTRLESLFRAEHSTNQLRREIWLAGWHMLEANWFSGIGILNFDWIYPLYQIADRGTAHLHLALLQIAVESGLFFCLSLVFLLLLLFKSARPHPEIQASGIALAIFCCFDYPLADLRIQVVLMLLLSIVLYHRNTAPPKTSAPQTEF